MATNDENGDWWQIKHGSGVGSAPLMVLLKTADRMEGFRSGVRSLFLETGGHCWNLKVFGSCQTLQSLALFARGPPIVYAPNDADVRDLCDVITSIAKGYEDNLVKGPSWSLNVLNGPLDDEQLEAVTAMGRETSLLWEERCSELEAAGDLDAECNGTAGENTTTTVREDTLRALRALHAVLSEVGVSPLDLQKAAALT